MFNLFKIFKPKMTGRIINMWEHSGWGNRISWFDFREGKIDGHLRWKPCVGDEIRSKMKSGKVLRSRVKEVKYCGDPPDMFFADLSIIGYLEGVAEPEKKEEGFKLL